jgi:hypothetical protein
MNLHELVAAAVKQDLGDTVQMFWAGECGQHDPIKNGLFRSDKKSRATRYVMPDGLLFFDCGIKVVLEIEESCFSPVHLFGKWAASVFSRYFIHERMDSAVLFSTNSTLIQICDVAKAREKNRTRHTYKTEQWPNVEDSIKQVIPLPGSNLAHYHLLWGSAEQFEHAGEMWTRLLNIVHEALDR